MKSAKLRWITAGAVIVVITIGFMANLAFGNLSALGWREIAILCPLGALTVMLAERMMIPQALISLAVVIPLIILFARAFCGWLCPIPLVQKLRNAFSKKPSKAARERLLTPDANLRELPVTQKPNEVSLNAATPEVPKELVRQKQGACGGEEGCSSCAQKRSKVDSRHFILGGSLVSAAVFGFPVFCLVCPIGLTFATIVLLIRLFADGDVTWSLIFVPALLIVEVVLFRKWCHKLCPLSAIMSLIGKLNRTFKPKIDDGRCLETAQGRSCGVCAKVCPEGINPRHPEKGAAWSECTKCRECVDSCPTKALTMPFLPHAAPTKKREMIDG